ncbi:hypothetical protein Mterra_02983 [Calidithermus terrae]|uniref:Uncharacterized protein n=1 Tax=Calidithermus terrae TaxID=1408545 RepID=A0A399ED71_9DEIN|nr:hypothetical protein [Calidithermus terrae]RIH81756.1 hypothetical protein Mterra_02983 [Calidithermus terrae]
MTPLEWIQHMLESNREALRQMPFPPGMADYVQELVQSGQTEQIINLMKLGFLIGIQQGAAQVQAGEALIQRPAIQA